MLKYITASIIQGSGIGPAAYVINAADIRTVIHSNDTYLLIPARNADTRSIELEDVDAWARANNLTLNKGQKEIKRNNRCRQKKMAPC